MGEPLPTGLHFVQDTPQDLAERDTRGHILELRLVPTSLIVSRFAESERNVAVFDHVLNLPSHYTMGASVHLSLNLYDPGYELVPLTRQAKKYNEIYHQHRPEHRHIENPKPRTNEGYGDRPCTRVPKFKFR